MNKSNKRASLTEAVGHNKRSRGAEEGRLGVQQIEKIQKKTKKKLNNKIIRLQDIYDDPSNSKYMISYNNYQVRECFETDR